MKALFTEDLEFYHDAGGLDGYAKTMENFQRVATNYGYTRRLLIKESVKVYPIKDYGAIQTGLHKFCRLEKGELINCGTFKFLHIWRKHQPAGKFHGSLVTGTKNKKLQNKICRSRFGNITAQVLAGNICARFNTMDRIELLC